MERNGRNGVLPALPAGLPYMCLALWALCLIPSVTLAQMQSGNEPIKIDARRIEVNQKTGGIVYRGQVTIEQGDLSISADLVRTRAQGGSTEIIQVFGNPATVRQEKGDGNEALIITAREMEYRPGSKKLVMQGSVLLQQGQDTIQSEIMRADLLKKIYTAEGKKPGERVHAVLHQAVDATPAARRDEPADRIGIFQ